VKYVAFLLVAVASFSFCQDNRPDPLTVIATAGAKQIHSGLRDPDSFKLDRVWIMHSDKHGDAVCYTYYARNGFGGMNHSAADYAPNRKGEYSLNPASDDWGGPTGNINAIFPGGFEYFSRCGQRAQKRDKMLKDVTEEVKKALTR